MKKEVFIEKAVAIHGDKFDYSLLPDEFKTNEKLPVSCKKHGVWYVTTGNHISNKRGCPSCGFEHVANLKKQKSRDSFEKDAIAIHGDRYDYSHVDYINSETKVKIGCKLHGMFEQIPYSHLIGNGCFKCGRDTSGAKQLDNKESFVAKARLVHGDKYCYDDLEYISQKHKVKISCKLHGYFWQKTNNHLNGNGCPKCLPDKLSEKNRDDPVVVKQRLITALKQTGNTLVDFSYVNCDSFCVARCAVHGEYRQRIRSILSNKGCPKCARGSCGYKPFLAGTFYILSVTSDIIKFGITNQFDKRLKHIKSRSCFNIEVLHRFDFDDGFIPRDIESDIIDSDIIKQVVNKCDMQSGYTETTYSFNIPKILSIVDKYKPD